MPMTNIERTAERGQVGKTDLVGLNGRATNGVAAEAVESTDASTLTEYVETKKFCTGDSYPYGSDEREREVVNLSVGDVRRSAYGRIRVFLSMFKREYVGVGHRVNAKRLRRYVAEFASRRNVREKDTMQQTEAVVADMVGMRLMYRDLAS